MDNKSAAKPRVVNLYPGEKGRFQGSWTLTDTKLADVVMLTIPPTHAIPIIFVPGIMGSNLCSLENKPIWLLNSVGNTPARLAFTWASKGPGERQKLLHPEKTRVYSAGAVPKKASPSARTAEDFLRRGWGEVSEASYHKFLLWLDSKMNSEINPANWEDFSSPSLKGALTPAERITAKLPAGLKMRMAGLPNKADGESIVEEITSDDLLKRSKSIYPIYAFGYNWLASNDIAASLLMKRIDQVILENNNGPIKCSQVILVTHSMGGLVARVCSQLPNMSKKIVGIVHGVMPATGAAVAYRRCKIGMREESFGAGLVIGSNGKEVTAVFAQSPGALQLLPSKDYGVRWLEVADPTGKRIVALPESDPYTEIYLQKEKWWGLVREEWLTPEDGDPINWEVFSKNIMKARAFHQMIANKYHHNTYVFYGGGVETKSYSKIRWNVTKGSLSEQGNESNGILSLVSASHKDIRTDGSNNLYMGGEGKQASKKSNWEIRCASYDSAGDGTVPKLSGAHPLQGGGACVRKQFELSGIQHEPAYRDYPAAQIVTYYSISKLAAMADLP